MRGHRGSKVLNDASSRELIRGDALPNHGTEGTHIRLSRQVETGEAGQKVAHSSFNSISVIYDKCIELRDMLN